MAIVFMFAYIAVVNEGVFAADINLAFMILIGGAIGISAFSFAASEMRETEGVTYTLDLGCRRIMALLLFALLIGIGYDALVLVLAEIFSIQVNGDIDRDSLQISVVMMAIVIGFLVIFPFFQFLFLARPGEGSSIPAEYPLESVMENLTEVLRSPFIAAVLFYGLLYLIPIALLNFLLVESLLTAVLLWALVLPLISLGALAGAGLGEDLIRLRLIRKPRDLGKLGFPKINLKTLSVEVGGLLLVIFALQALAFTAYYGIVGIRVWLGLETGQASLILNSLVLTLLINFFNKGRGALKELKEVWTESGFKVSIFQLFLPVFVFLGVILSSALEVFVNQSGGERGTLIQLGLAPHVRLSSFFLVLQNFVLIFTALYILRTTPGTAERRLIKEVPEFYGEDLSGYRFIYNKLRDEKSIENLIKEMTKKVVKNKEQAEFLKSLLKDSLDVDNNDVKTAIGEAISFIVRHENRFDQDSYEITTELLNSNSVGAQIYAIRTMKSMLLYLEGEEKEEALTYMQTFISHDDPVVSWDTSLVLFRILRDEPAYRSFVLAQMISTLSMTDKISSIEAITRFFRKIAEESNEIGQMAISTLAVRLTSGGIEDPEKLISGIKALLRGNPELTEDLIDQVAVTLQHPDEELRSNSYLVLGNMAEYGTGKEDEILELILGGIDDESEKIQEIAYAALTKEVDHAVHLIPRIFEILQNKFVNLRGVPLLGALDVVREVSFMDRSYDEEILILIIGATNSSTPEVRRKVLGIFGDIALQNPELSEDMFRIAESNLLHDSDIVREAAVSAFGKIVVGNANYANTIYRELKKSREDESYTVQLAAIEAMGFVAAASDRLADEIFQSLLPLLNDADWQVRLAALNGLFAAVKVRSSLKEPMVEATTKALQDPNVNIRLQTLDITTWIMSNYRNGGEMLVEYISKNLKSSSSEEYSTMLNTMEIIAGNQILLFPAIIRNIQPAYEMENNNVRFSANETLKAGVSKLVDSRNINSEVRKSLNQLITKLMKAANNSSPKIRQSAYTAITEICASVPESKVADRGRNALFRASKLEKDIALIEFLEEANIRAKKPLDFDFGGKA